MTDLVTGFTVDASTGGLVAPFPAGCTTLDTAVARLPTDLPMAQVTYRRDSGFGVVSELLRSMPDRDAGPLMAELESAFRACETYPPFTISGKSATMTAEQVTTPRLGKRAVAVRYRVDHPDLEINIDTILIWVPGAVMTIQTITLLDSVSLDESVTVAGLAVQRYSAG